MDLGGEGPYLNVLEALADLRLLIDPKNIPTAFRMDARRLRSILKGIHECMKNCAVRRFQRLVWQFFAAWTPHASPVREQKAGRLRFPG